jgi:hypothetical protein
VLPLQEDFGFEQQQTYRKTSSQANIQVINMGVKKKAQAGAASTGGFWL